MEYTASTPRFVPSTNLFGKRSKTLIVRRQFNGSNKNYGHLFALNEDLEALWDLTFPSNEDYSKFVAQKTSSDEIYFMMLWSTSIEFGKVNHEDGKFMGSKRYPATIQF